MDNLTFVARIVEAIAWPAVAGIALWIFRKALEELFGRVTEFSFPGGVKGVFRDSMARAMQLGVHIKSLGSANAEQALIPDDLAALRANPAGVIMEAWLAVLTAGRDLVKRFAPNAIESTDSRGVLLESEVVKTLLKSGQLSNDEVALFRQLREVRNQAAHNPSVRPTSDEASRFKELAEALILRWAVRLHAVEGKAE